MASPNAPISSAELIDKYSAARVIRYTRNSRLPRLQPLPEDAARKQVKRLK